MQFLGMFRHVRTSHAQGLTREMFVSLGQSAVSAQDVYAQGALIVMAEGEMRNRNTLARALKLSYDASMSLITARAYRMWGADYPRHIEGNVVTAVIDRTEDRMILSSDRAGAIGVYYAWRGRSAAFASHPDLLLKMGAAGRRIGREGMNELFATGGFFTPGKTAFQDIRSLEGGCVLIADPRGMRVKRYYSAIQEALKEEKEPFFISDYIKTIPAAEHALFLSGGFSMEMADEMKKGAGAVLYHATSDQSAEEKIESFSKKINAPVECVDVPSDLYADSLKEIVTNTGFPGTGINESVLQLLMKKACGLFPSVLIGGNGVFFCENMQSGNLLRFLRRDMLRKMDTEGYMRDRFNDLIDRLHIPLCDTGAEEWAEKILCASVGASQFALRMRLLNGNDVRTPLSDERFVAHMLRNLTQMEDTHSLRKGYAKECVSKIIDEAMEMAESEDQPIFSCVEPGEIQKEIRSERPDVTALSRLIQINSFLYQFEAEISLL